MLNTPNLNLNKPDRLDFVYVSDLNENMDILDNIIAIINVNISGKADLHSPNFSGNPTVPTPPPGDISFSIVNTEYLNMCLEVKVLVP